MKHFNDGAPPPAMIVVNFNNIPNGVRACFWQEGRNGSDLGIWHIIFCQGLPVVHEELKFLLVAYLVTMRSPRWHIDGHYHSLQPSTRIPGLVTPHLHTHPQRQLAARHLKSPPVRAAPCNPTTTNDILRYQWRCAQLRRNAKNIIERKKEIGVSLVTCTTPRWAAARLY